MARSKQSIRCRCYSAWFDTVGTSTSMTVNKNTLICWVLRATPPATTICISIRLPWYGGLLAGTATSFYRFSVANVCFLWLCLFHHRLHWRSTRCCVMDLHSKIHIERNMYNNHFLHSNNSRIQAMWSYLVECSIWATSLELCYTININSHHPWSRRVCTLSRPRRFLDREWSPLQEHYFFSPPSSLRTKNKYADDWLQLELQ